MILNFYNNSDFCVDIVVESKLDYEVVPTTNYQHLNILFILYILQSHVTGTGESQERMKKLKLEEPITICDRSDFHPLYLIATNRPPPPSDVHSVYWLVPVVFLPELEDCQPVNYINLFMGEASLERDRERER